MLLLRFLLFISISFSIFISSVDATCLDNKSNSDNYYSLANSYFDKYIGATSKDPNRSSYYSDYQKYNNLYKDAYNNYLNCRLTISKVFDQGLTAFNDKKYQTAISYFHQYLSENGDTTDVDYKSAKTNLALSYINYANIFYLREDYENAKTNLLKGLEQDPSNYFGNYQLGFVYVELNELNNALLYFQSAYSLGANKSEIANAKNMIDLVNKDIENQTLKLNAPSNDPLSYLQYYIKDLNIDKAWKQVTNPKPVIVAVIDDGISINHPDLLGNIWVNPNSEYGSNKVIDFVGDNLKSNIPAGEHGTMVAGIIGANTNNNEGGAGIAKKVKLMPLRVFGLDGKGRTDSITNAIKYAIDNGANIINLSLGENQFTYNKGFDEIIKKAFDKGIIVVIAGGNGDLLTNEKTGVNLNINPIAPVCNNKGSNYSFGVFATNKEGYRTDWTNFGDCTPFFAPGEGILSSSIPFFNSQFGENYNILNGTSFSTPIIAGIIALGYNKYGALPPSTIFDALKISTTLNKNKQPVLDAEKYLNNLQSYFDNQITNKAKIQFQKYKDSFSRLSNTEKKKKYQTLLKTLQARSKKLKGNVKKETDFLIDYINKEVSKL